MQRSCLNDVWNQEIRNVEMPVTDDIVLASRAQQLPCGPQRGL